MMSTRIFRGYITIIIRYMLENTRNILWMYTAGSAIKIKLVQFTPATISLM